MSECALETSNALNYRAWGMPVRAFPGSFRNSSGILLESLSRTGGMAHLRNNNCTTATVTLQRWQRNIQQFFVECFSPRMTNVHLSNVHFVLGILLRHCVLPFRSWLPTSISILPKQQRAQNFAKNNVQVWKVHVCPSLIQGHYPPFFAHPFFPFFLPCPPHPSPGNSLPPNPLVLEPQTYSFC